MRTRTAELPRRSSHLSTGREIIHDRRSRRDVIGATAVRRRTVAALRRRTFAEAAARRIGTWDISAVASFAEGADCRGASHELRATVRVAITP